MFTSSSFKSWRGITSVIIISFIALFSIANPVKAETRVSGDVYGGSWTKSGSPYILEGSVTVLSGFSLTIEPGVVIDADPTLDNIPEIRVNGYLMMRGSADEHITVKGIWGIDIGNATATISYADISTNYGLYMISSHASVSSSTISDAYNGVYIESGSLDISASRIEGNEYGIFVHKYKPIFMVMDHPIYVADADVSFGSHLATALSLPPAEVTISGSSLADDRSAAIKNTETDPDGAVMAVNDWWGSAAGPNIASSTDAGASVVNDASSSAIIGPVIYNPWLDHDPTRVITKPACCSSVLFLPGIESSRLYVNEKGILGSGIGWGTSANTLWEPNRNDDVRKLFLNTDGSSVDKNIYSGGVIDSAWGYGVYGKFMSFMDGLVAKGNMNEWLPFGYDWRKPISDVVLGKEKKATTTVSLMQTVANLASRSKTGKVTIIAHSNGGLVAKYLVKALADIGSSSLIDSVISVAVPYLGTPEAIGGILHGDDESLAGGWLLETSVARQLGQNMSSAYSLLPSTDYFKVVPGSVISFSSTTPRSVNSGSYPMSIASFSDEKSFMTDAKGTRKAVAVSDIESPIKSNVALMASAGSLHDMLDAFSWPKDIAGWAISGWNAMTTKGIVYRASSGSASSGTASSGSAANASPAHDAIETNMGDGTVVARSASYDDGTTTSIDLKQALGGGTLHGNILNSATTQSLIADLLEDTPAADKERAIVSIPGVTLGQPDYSKEATYIKLSTHSPVQLHVYDSQGRHTGETVPPADMPTDLKSYEQGIPGSSFRIDEHDDADYDTIIYVPDDGTKYSVAINGTGAGSFTFDVDRMRGGQLFDHAEYADLPVTPMTIATTTIQFSPTDIPTPPGVPLGIASSTFMADIKPLAVDVDGDGTVDIQAKQGSTTDQGTYWESMKKACRTMFGPYSDKDQDKHGGSNSGLGKVDHCKAISDRIDHIEDMAKKGKLKKLNDFSIKIGQYSGHRWMKNLSDDDRQKMGDMLDALISQFE